MAGLPPCVMAGLPPCVMAGLGPATHDFPMPRQSKTWVAGPRSAMTQGGSPAMTRGESASTAPGVTCSSRGMGQMGLLATTMERLLKTRYGLEIRAATGADAQGLCDLLSAAGREVSPSDSSERLDAIRREPGAALIAAEWGPPIGLVVLHWYRTLEADQPTAQITTLLVAPDERRRGIGRLLVKTAAQAARVAGCGALELLAAPEQEGLLQFCSATGFTEISRRFVRPLRKKGQPP
jgi:aminoglycoside 6'-N-acetyltransferase I